MTRETKKVVVLRGVYPDTFEEVIFILKKDASLLKSGQANLVFEARKIVDNYAKGISQPQVVESHENIYYDKNNKINGILNIALAISIMIFLSLIINVFK